MHEKRITVTLQNNGRGQEEAVEIPVLAILSVNEVWEWVQYKNPDGTLQRKNHVYFGTHIASHMHMGWLVKERSPRIEQMIDQAAKHNKHYRGECNCWGTKELPIPCSGSMYLQKRSRRAA